MCTALEDTFFQDAHMHGHVHRKLRHERISGFFHKLLKVTGRHTDDKLRLHPWSEGKCDRPVVEFRFRHEDHRVALAVRQ